MHSCSVGGTTTRSDVRSGPARRSLQLLKDRKNHLNANQDLTKLCNPIARFAKITPELQFTSFLA